MQELAAQPEASKQEESSVRQAIEEVLARVDLAHSRDADELETKQHDTQQAAEQTGEHQRVSSNSHSAALD